MKMIKKKYNFKWKNCSYYKKKIQKNLLLSYKNNSPIFYTTKRKNFRFNKKNKPSRKSSNLIEFKLIEKKIN